MKVREIERKRETLREEGGALQGEWADVPSCSASLGFTTSFPFLLLITNHLYEYIFVNEKAANEILRITSSWLFLCPLKEINDLFDLHWILLIKKPWSYMFFFLHVALSHHATCTRVLASLATTCRTLIHPNSNYVNALVNKFYCWPLDARGINSPKSLILPMR